MEMPSIELVLLRSIDSSSITLINKILPDEIYNLAAQSHVAVSFKNPIYSTHTSTVGTVTILESIRNLEKEKILSGFLFKNVEVIRDMLRGFSPDKKSICWQGVLSQYNKNIQRNMGCLQLMGFFLITNPHRGETFVTRKISRQLVEFS